MSSRPAWHGKTKPMPEPAPSPRTEPETPAEPLSRTDGVIIPLALLFLVNVVVFSALISFRLRPNVGGRMLPIMGISFAGLLAGALVFPRFADWTGTARSCGRWGWQRVLAAAWSVFALATVLPGTRQYIENEPLRYVANFVMCLSIAPAYYLFFSRFPVRRRGVWFGATEAVGIVIWLFLSYLAHGVPVSAEPPHHPLLSVVYNVHAGAGALAAALLLYALVFSRTPWAGTAVAEQNASEPTSHRITAFALLAMGFAVFSWAVFSMPN